MSAPPLTGRTDRARADENLRGLDTRSSTSQAESVAPEIAQAIALGFKRRRAVQLVKFWQAQANHAASFVDWLTYADPTGEQATDNALWHHAKSVA